MRKSTLLATATLLLLTFATPVSAFAAAGTGSGSGSGSGSSGGSSNTSDDDLTGGVQIFDGTDDSPGHDKIHKDNIKKHHDLEGRYGDNYGSLPMPPLAIKPGKGSKPNYSDLDDDSNENSNNGVLPNPGVSPMPSVSGAPANLSGTNTTGKSSVTNYVTAPVLPNKGTSNSQSTAKMPAQIDPASNSPIAMTDVRISGQTPATDFMNESFIWAGILGAAAIALGGIVGFTTIRARKNPSKDHIYEA